MSVVEREKEFHNLRFSDGGDNRNDQLKYYWAIQRGSDEFFSDIAKALEKNPSQTVLEYGCGLSSNSKKFAGSCKEYHAIDISDMAIEALTAENKFPNAHFHVMDAMKMDFPDETFDIVFGCGIIHHLDIEKSCQEIKRVLKPGGIVIFWEPLGFNPLINMYRMVTPSARTPDEHPLVQKDFSLMKKCFGELEIKKYGLMTLFGVPFRNKAYGAGLYNTLDRLDRMLFSMPFIGQMAWYASLKCRKSGGSQRN